MSLPEVLTLVFLGIAGIFFLATLGQLIAWAFEAQRVRRFKRECFKRESQ